MDVDGWRQTVLRDIARLEMGETLIAKDLTGDGLPVYSANRDPLPWGHTSLARKRYRRGTIVVGARGSLGFPRLPDHDLFTSTQTTIAVSPSETVYPAYLLAVLASVNYDEIGAKQAVPMLTVKQLGGVGIGVPPIAEQKKIAKILANVDEAIQATQAVIEQTRKVKQGLLQQLLTRGIGHTRFKQTEIGEIPESWDVASLDELMSAPICYGVLKPGPDTPGGIYVVRVQNYPGNKLRLADVQRSAPEIVEPFARSTLRQDDLLISIRGTAGRVCWVPRELDGANISRDSARLRLADPSLVRWVFYYLQTNVAQQFVSGNMRGMAVKGINIADLRQLPVPLPSAHERASIQGVLDEASSTMEALLDESECLKRLKAGLMSDLLSGRVRVKVDA